MVPSARQAREGWGLLIASTVRLTPQGLLSLRYIDGLVLKISTDDVWESGKTKSRPG
jgi:hypothetical protein